MNQLMMWLDGQKGNARLILRVLLAVILIYAGYQKIFVWGIGNVTANFTQMGLIAAPVLGFLVPILEFFGGIAILLGVFSRLLSVWVVVQFILIAVYVKPMLMPAPEYGIWSGLWPELTLATMGLMLLTGGPGPLSLADRIFKGKSWAQ